MAVACSRCGSPTDNIATSICDDCEKEGAMSDYTIKSIDAHLWLEATVVVEVECEFCKNRYAAPSCNPYERDIRDNTCPYCHGTRRIERTFKVKVELCRDSTFEAALYIHHDLTMQGEDDVIEELITRHLSGEKVESVEEP